MSREIITPEYVEGFIPEKPGIYANSVHGLVTVREIERGMDFVCHYDCKMTKELHAQFLSTIKGFWSFRLEIL